MLDILLTWVGMRDPYWDNPRTRATRETRGDFGPILSLIQEHARTRRPFDLLYLFVNVPSKDGVIARRATEVQRVIERERPNMQVRQQPVDLVRIDDHREVYRATNDACQRILKAEGTAERRYWVYLSPGTPAMHAVWVLLVQSGLLPATMLVATPPELLTPGAPAIREVDLSLSDFPQMVTPDEVGRRLGILEAQNDNLIAENCRLQAELALLQSGAPATDDQAIREGFQLRDYLEALEQSFYVRALDQAHEHAANAARLLGIEPPAFRARAERLGIRPRRRRGET